MIAAESGPVDIEGPATAKWETKADANTMKALFVEFKQSSSKPFVPNYEIDDATNVPISNPDPVAIKIGKISRDGFIELKFN